MSTEIVIVELDKVAEQIKEAKEVANFLPDVSSNEGYEKSKRVSLDIGKMLTALEKTRKEKKEYFLQGGRQVDKQAEALREQLEQARLPHKEAYKKLDEERKQREDDRKAAHEKRIYNIEMLPETLVDADSVTIKKVLSTLVNNKCEGFEEYETKALRVKDDTIKVLSAKLNDREKREKDAAELARLQEEEAKRKQEAREEEIRKEARAKAEAESKKAQEEKSAAEAKAKKAEEDKIAAEYLAKKAQADAETLAKKNAHEKKLAEELAEKNRIAAEAKAKKDAADAADKARKEEIARQEAVKIEEQKIIAKREADQAHIGKIRGEAKDSLIALGIDEAKAKEIVIAIHNGKIKNVKIIY